MPKGNILVLSYWSKRVLLCNIIPTHRRFWSGEKNILISQLTVKTSPNFQLSAIANLVLLLFHILHLNHGALSFSSCQLRQEEGNTTVRNFVPGCRASRCAYQEMVYCYWSNPHHHGNKGFCFLALLMYAETLGRWRNYQRKIVRMLN